MMPRPLPILALLLALIPLPARAAPGDDLLRFDALHTLHLKVSAKSWDAIQPNRRGGLSALFASTRPTPDAEPPKVSPFGYQYAYAPADVEFNNQTLPNVGLRFKGNSSYMLGRDFKKPFKLDLNYYAKQQLDGLVSLNLNNNAIDPTLMREALSYAVFRDAGAPAPRTAYALVYVTVDGAHDRKLAGLYTLVEEIDKRFLTRHYGSARGLLLKPENALGLPYLGPDPARYEKMYRPKTNDNPPPAAWQRLVDFLHLIHKADDPTFDKTIDTYLDVDGFLRFIAVNTLLSNMDSILTTGHNFYLYVHPDTLKIHFVPWDTNLSFGTFDWPGTIKEQADLSIRQPWVGPHRLIERVLKNKRLADRYHREIDRLTATTFNPAHLGARIDQLEKLIADAYRRANLTPATQPTTRPLQQDIRRFVQLRHASVRAQRDGTADGYTPYWQRGVFGRGRPATRPTTQPATRAAAATTRPAAARAE